MMLNRSNFPVNHLLTLVLCVLFALLWGVWLLPHTVFIRHTSIGLGAFLSLFVIYPRRQVLWQRYAFPLGLIFLLLVWVSLHVFLIDQDFSRQWQEYQTIWKKVAISCVFAVGLGLAISSQMNNKANSRKYWQIIYLGFLLPSIIYFCKYCLALVANKYQLQLSPYLELNSNHFSHEFGISRARYVFFCLPALAIGLGQIANAIKMSCFRWQDQSIYILSIPLTLMVFAHEGDRLGAAFALLFVLIFIFQMVLLSFQKKRSKRYLLGIIFIVISSLFVLKGVSFDNPVWATLWADAKIAFQVDRYDGWQTRVMPLNESGRPVNASNYERISWAIVGSRLLFQNPLGYGLLSLSFGGLGKQIWPNADLSWTHSAWLDIALGYGLPGIILLLSAIGLILKGSVNLAAPWRQIAISGLGSMTLVMFAKELSTEVVVNAIIFVATWAATMNLIKIDKNNLAI